MNIFIFDPNLVTSAEYFFQKDFRRANKQIVEICQILANSSTIFTLLKMDDTPYKKTKSISNHPVTIWTARSPYNFMLTAVYGHALCLEYENKKNKEHGCKETLESCFVEDTTTDDVIELIDQAKVEHYWKFFGKFEDYDSSKNVFENYKAYLDMKLEKEKN